MPRSQVSCAHLPPLHAAPQPAILGERQEDERSISRKRKLYKLDPLSD